MKDKFDPAFLVYLNPRAVAEDALTVENAADAYERNPSLVYVRPRDLPKSFNEKVYIEDHKDVADISSLNAYIRAVDPDACDNEYVDSIRVRMTLVKRNTFKVERTDVDWDMDCKVINVGDHVRIRRGRTDVAHGRVVELDRFLYEIKVVNPYYDFLGEDERWELLGVRLVDVRRVAVINYAMSLLRRVEYLPLQRGLCKMDPTFNVELYKLLYPDARSKDAFGAYLDYVSRLERGDSRVKCSSDFATRVSLVIDQPVTFMGHMIDNISTDLTSRQSPSRNRASSLTTDRAVVDYVDRKAVFDQPRVVFDGEVAFAKSITSTTGRFSDSLRSFRIGIGACGGADDADVVECRRRHVQRRSHRHRQRRSPTSSCSGSSSSDSYSSDSTSLTREYDDRSGDHCSPSSSSSSSLIPPCLSRESSRAYDDIDDSTTTKSSVSTLHQRVLPKRPKRIKRRPSVLITRRMLVGDDVRDSFSSSTAIDTAKLYVSGGARVDGLLEVDGPMRCSDDAEFGRVRVGGCIESSGDVGIEGTLKVGGQSTFRDGIVVEKNVICDAIGIGGRSLRGCPRFSCHDPRIENICRMLGLSSIDSFEDPYEFVLSALTTIVSKSYT